MEQTEQHARDQAVANAFARIGDLVYPLQDYACAYILGRHLPHLEPDEATLVRRIADEALAELGLRAPSPDG